MEQSINLASGMRNFLFEFSNVRMWGSRIFHPKIYYFRLVLMANLLIKLTCCKLAGEKQSLIICIPPVYMVEIQENWVTCQNDGRLHLKYHFQLKTKDIEGGKPVMGSYQEEQSKLG